MVTCLGMWCLFSRPPVFRLQPNTLSWCKSHVCCITAQSLCLCEGSLFPLPSRFISRGAHADGFDCGLVVDTTSLGEGPVCRWATSPRVAEYAADDILVIELGNVSRMFVLGLTSLPVRACVCVVRLLACLLACLLALRAWWCCLAACLVPPSCASLLLACLRACLLVCLLSPRLAACGGSIACWQMHSACCDGLE